MIHRCEDGVVLLFCSGKNSFSYYLPLILGSREGARSLQQSSRVSTPEGRVNRHGIGAASGGASELIPDGPFEVSSNHNNVVSLGDKSTICVHDTEKWE